MSYKQLQEEAKTLGIKYVGVSKKKLKKAIEAAKSNTPSVSSSNSPSSSVEPPKPKVNKKVNTAIVRDGKNEIRRYTLEIHGEDFAKKAKEFSVAKDRTYKVELVEVKPGLTCSNCGSIVSA